MGANAQTTVPTFTASQVLTADQMNQSARTGVPVFSTTTTRDAGFGGTGEKTLAEGQMCYVEGTGFQTYNGTSWVTWGAAAPGLTLIKSASFSAVTSVTVDSVFTSTYVDYVINLRYHNSGAVNIDYVNRVGGVNATTNYNVQLLSATSTTVAASRLTAQSSHSIGNEVGGTFWSYSSTIVSGPALAEATVFSTNVSRAGGAYTVPRLDFNYGNHSTATAYDGFQLAVSTGTMTGTYTVYGLR